jgi:hypothetical protein
MVEVEGGPRLLFKEAPPTPTLIIEEGIPLWTFKA